MISFEKTVREKEVFKSRSIIINYQRNHRDVTLKEFYGLKIVLKRSDEL